MTDVPAPVTLEFLGRLMQRLVDDVATMKDDISVIAHQLRGVDARLASIDGQLRGMNSKLDRLDRRVRVLEERDDASVL